MLQNNENEATLNPANRPRKGKLCSTTYILKNEEDERRPPCPQPVQKRAQTAVSEKIKQRNAYLGQPVPLSYFVPELKSGTPETALTQVPSVLIPPLYPFTVLPWNGRSVPACLVHRKKYNHRKTKGGGASKRQPRNRERLARPGACTEK